MEKTPPAKSLNSAERAGERLAAVSDWMNTTRGAVITIVTLSTALALGCAGMVTYAVNNYKNGKTTGTHRAQ